MDRKENYLQDCVRFVAAKSCYYIQVIPDAAIDKSRLAREWLSTPITARSISWPTIASPRGIIR